MKNCRLKFNLLLGNGNLLDVPLVIAGNHLDTVSVRKHADNRPVSNSGLYCFFIRQIVNFLMQLRSLF